MSQDIRLVCLKLQMSFSSSNLQIVLHWIFVSFSLFSTIGSILYIWYFFKLVIGQFYLRIYRLLFNHVFWQQRLPNKGGSAIWEKFPNIPVIFLEGLSYSASTWRVWNAVIKAGVKTSNRWSLRLPQFSAVLGSKRPNSIILCMNEVHTLLKYDPGQPTCSFLRSDFRAKQCGLESNYFYTKTLNISS